jgi:hypothetical protein
MMPLAMLAQGAAEYGAISGGAAGSSSMGQTSPLLDPGLAFIQDNPLVLILAGLTLLLVIGLFRTQGYRS